MCKMNKIQISLATAEDKFFPRDKISYVEDMKLNDYNSSGIKSECDFHEIFRFDATNNLSV